MPRTLLLILCIVAWLACSALALLDHNRFLPFRTPSGMTLRGHGIWIGSADGNVTDVSSLLGFHYISFASRDRSGTSHLLIVPYWLLSALSVAPLLICIRHAMQSARARRRTNQSRCPTCGYDLRAHNAGDRCPECGTLNLRAV